MPYDVMMARIIPEFVFSRSREGREKSNSQLREKANKLNTHKFQQFC